MTVSFTYPSQQRTNGAAEDKRAARIVCAALALASAVLLIRAVSLW